MQGIRGLQEGMVISMAEKSFNLRIITPDRVFYEGEAEMVEFNTTEGQVGVLPGHIPLTVIIKPGILHIYEADGAKTAALHAEIVEWPDEIDEGRAEAARERAEERLRSRTPETDVARAETALQRAIARIQVLK